MLIDRSESEILLIGINSINEYHWPILVKRFASYVSESPDVVVKLVKYSVLWERNIFCLPLYFYFSTSIFILSLT